MKREDRETIKKIIEGHGNIDKNLINTTFSLLFCS